MKELLIRYSDTWFKQDTEPGSVLRIPSGARVFFSCAVFLKKSQKNKTVVVTAASNQDAGYLAEEACSYLPEEDVVWLPGYEGIPYEFAAYSAEITMHRIRALDRILTGKPCIIFTSPEAVMKKFPDPKRLHSVSLKIEKGKNYSFSDLQRSLSLMGYSRSSRTELPGEFSVKGSIIDLYPVGSQLPVRLDFFDDELESIHSFDVETQLKAGKKESEKSITILPAGEFFLTPEESKKLDEILSGTDLLYPDWVGSPEEGGIYSQMNHPGIEQLYSFAAPLRSLSEITGNDTFHIIWDRERLLHREEQIIREYRTLYEKDHQSKVCADPENLLSLPLISETAAELSLLGESETTFGLESITGFRGRIRELRDQITAWIGSGRTVIISSLFPAQMNRVAGIFRTEKDLTIEIVPSGKPLQIAKGKNKKVLYIVQSGIREGFLLKDTDTLFLSDADIFGRSYRKKNHFRNITSSPVDSFLDLKEGDYVVHITHGIGRFLGLERVEAAGRERDFLVLEYADDDRLFVPLDQISLVQKYSSHIEKPKLDSLGRASFKKVRERVEEKIEEFAAKLVKLYAVRIKEKGFAFPPDTAWQEEFESEFPYEETPDQIAAIEAVKRDMESEKPMDRLVCGDVGYGKTEVAIRAAFKAVMSGKQVAIIAPTTILAMQHFRNISERFKNYPVTVDWISRFRSRREITEARKKLKEGEIDVIIGTHALLSKDVAMKNLGLLIVDEEQRFGVNHKETIKSVRKLVDVLTLTATPIPRTLHMSLTGIRDISIIQTPPQDRLAVRTYVMEDSDAVLTEAVQRELARDGQVFFLHNRVETIEIQASRIQKLLPEVRLATLHGQMTEDQIEDILMDFLERKYDMLVTTSIIESGIDMPNVNTLIIDRADMFGLAQLYQIRGRVGRSNRQAYAYLFYPAGRSLTELAQKRLSTILEYQELGSGFKVSMRDLEIRGAGNVLGKEQSGEIVEVGYELYVKLLDEAVRRLKGETSIAEIRTAINLKTDFYLPEDYITDTRQRIEFYKKYEAARDDEEVQKIFTQMEDRFGKAPETAVTFVLIETIRTLASLCGFAAVYETENGRILMKASDSFRVPPLHVIDSLKKGLGLSVEPKSADTMYFTPRGKGNSSLEELTQALKFLSEPVKKQLASEDGVGEV